MLHQLLSSVECDPRTAHASEAATGPGPTNGTSLSLATDLSAKAKASLEVLTEPRAHTRTHARTHARAHSHMTDQASTRSRHITHGTHTHTRTHAQTHTRTNTRLQVRKRCTHPPYTITETDYHTSTITHSHTRTHRVTRRPIEIARSRGADTHTHRCTVKQVHGLSAHSAASAVADALRCACSAKAS